MSNIKLPTWLTKFSRTDYIHVILGFFIFRYVWLEATHTFNSYNGIWFGFSSVIALSIFKELNDHFGWFKWLLTDGETKTGADASDIWKAITIPLVIMIINYLIYK